MEKTECNQIKFEEMMASIFFLINKENIENLMRKINGKHQSMDWSSSKNKLQSNDKLRQTENLKDSTIKQLALINSAREQDATLIYRNQFLYTNNEISERKIKERTPSTIIWKRIKYQGISLPTEVKDL